MRRTTMATMTAALVLSAAPVAAQDAEESAEPAEPQRAEATAFGISMEFPGEWRVSQPEGLRVSAITTADGEPVMETTALMAMGAGGTWCDVDAYLALDAPLEGHAYAYATYLQQNESADATMVVADTEIPAGPAYRIEVFNQATGRIRAMYLFDGPAAADGTFNRYLFTCAAREVTEPFWEAIAESAQVFEPVSAEAEEAASDG